MREPVPWVTGGRVTETEPAVLGTGPRPVAGASAYHGAVEGDGVVRDEADLPVPSFQSQVALWFTVWSADRPELVDRARAVADPETDPWGYLAALGELLADAA